ncbi:hypothetical protein GGF40_002040 [Coemansia sp. RSA 1286]|nr:hypothetical protein IWW45_007793 [Coemansia sp. RSA 485]KAJ2637887.1 hypothetical protein GGF40_002040 [Coemansia sp. RSA 1286]
MSSNTHGNGSGNINDSGYGHPQFRPGTAKAAMNSSAPQTQQYYSSQPPQHQHYPASAPSPYGAATQYQSAYSLGVGSNQHYGAVSSAIPAPQQGFVLQQAPQGGYQQVRMLPQQMVPVVMAGYPPQHLPQAGFYATAAPPNMQILVPGNVQQTMIPHSRPQTATQPQQHHTPRNGSATNGAHQASSANNADDADLSAAMIEDDLRRMGISSGQAPTTPHKQAFLAPRKKASAEALRKREQKLEDEYDNDDGSTGFDLDTSLFPSNAKQMASVRHSEKYGAMGAHVAGHETRSSSSSSLGKNHIEATNTNTNTTDTSPLPPTKNTVDSKDITTDEHLRTNNNLPLPLLLQHPHFANNTTTHAEPPTHQTSKQLHNHTEKQSLHKGVLLSNSKQMYAFTAVNQQSPSPSLSPLSISKSKSLRGFRRKSSLALRQAHQNEHDRSDDHSHAHDHGDSEPQSPVTSMFSNLNLLARQRHRRLLRQASLLASPTTTDSSGIYSPLTKSRFLLRRRLSDVSIFSQRSSAASSSAHSPASPQQPTLQPLSPRALHWRKCTNISAQSPHKDTTPIITTTTITTTTIRTTTSTKSTKSKAHTRNHKSTPISPNNYPEIVAANPILVSTNNAKRPTTARKASPLVTQLPADIANPQRIQTPGSSSGSGSGSMRSGMQNISATGPGPGPQPHQGRPYLRDDGFDSSSDRLPMGSRAMPQHQQHQQQGQQMYANQAPPAGFHADPRSVNGPQMRSGSPFGQPHGMQSSPGLGPGSIPGAPYGNMPNGNGKGGVNGNGNGGHLAAASNYSHSSSSDVLGLPEPGTQMYANMRPWTASSKSLPGAIGPGQFVDRDAPSSGASSTVGMPPMNGAPLASNAPVNSQAKPPPPTMASLEAYRSSIKRSKDPAAQLDFAKYVLEHARGMSDQEPNPKQRQKLYEMLTMEGLKWVKKLAGSGITVHRSNIAAEAQFFLGTVYSQGIYGVERDDARAFSYYQQASKAQHAEANYRTAVCHEVGVGTRCDQTRALQFYRKSAAQSNVPAMYKLGVILIKGALGTAPAPREGITWLKRAADSATAECPHALHELALCHESSEIPGIIPDDSYARELYIKAGKLGYVPSQVRLGQAYEYGTMGCPVDPRRSIGWYTRAAEKGDPDAELALSGWYLTGAEPNLPQNDVEAYLWARRAADHGLAKAEYAVGYYYECGIGVSYPDVQEAQKWYNKAAKKNNRRAIARLKELKQMGVYGGAAPAIQRPHRGKDNTMF